MRYSLLIVLAFLLSGCSMLNLDTGRETRNQAHVKGVAMDVCERIFDDQALILGCTLVIKVSDLDEYIAIFYPWGDEAYEKASAVQPGDGIRTEAAIQANKLVGRAINVKEN